VNQGDLSSTEGLARRARDEDLDAFEEIFRRYRKRLTVWVSLRMGPLLRSRLNPDDVVQETFLEAHRSLSDFRDRGGGSFRKWLFAVAENRIRDLHKYHTAQKRDPGREIRAAASTGTGRVLDRLVADTASPSSGAHRREQKDRVLDGIDRMPEPLREVLLLRAIAEWSYREIAERLGRSESSVKILFVRGLSRLREELRAPGSGA
jgi:RNA polymerase sigma-70 factor (ECF subfamily)